MDEQNDDSILNNLSPEEIDELFEDIIELPALDKLAGYEGRCGAKWTNN